MNRNHEQHIVYTSEWETQQDREELDSLCASTNLWFANQLVGHKCVSRVNKLHTANELEFVLLNINFLCICQIASDRRARNPTKLIGSKKSKVFYLFYMRFQSDNELWMTIIISCDGWAWKRERENENVKWRAIVLAKAMSCANVRVIRRQFYVENVHYEPWRCHFSAWSMRRETINPINRQNAIYYYHFFCFQDLFVLFVCRETAIKCPTIEETKFHAYFVVDRSS